MPNNIPRLPTKTDRIVEIGRTGTGKTVCGLWHLSNFDLDSMPWIIFNFKRDEHIESIDKALPVDFSFFPGKKEAGLFVINPTPYDLAGNSKERSAFDKYLLKLWERERVGIFIDEMYMVGDSDPLILCLTQGRSKRIPMILCTQRPVMVTRFAFSEASFIQTFDLNDSRDINTVEEFVPIDWDEEKPLEKHESFYYEVARNKVFRMLPVPNMNRIREILDDKLPLRRVRI